MKFIYTYTSKYTNKSVIEQYEVQADSRDKAEYLTCMGCADLITEHNEPLGRLENMKLLKVEEK